MRLLVIVNVYRPDLGGGVLFADLCEGLVDRGFDVEVRCAYPYYPEWEDKSGQNGMDIVTTAENGVRVSRYGIYIPKSPESFLARLCYESSFLLSLSRRLPRPGEFDLVMTFCPLVGGVGYGILAAVAAGTPLWLNVQDLSAEAAEATGIVRSSRLGSILRGVQRLLFNRADVWSTISPVMRDRLTPLAGRGQTVHELPNWLHGTLALALAQTGATPARLARDPLKLLYSGNVGGKQDLIRLCKALSNSSAAFTFDIRAGGTEAGRLQQWAAETGDSRFTIGALTDERSLAAALRACDLFVVTEKEGAGGSFIPSKLLPALGSGTPVLAVCDLESPLGREMDTSGAGPSFRWTGLPRVVGLLEDPSALENVLAKWQKLASARSLHFDRERIIDQYAALMRGVVSDSEKAPSPHHE
ncbi:MAG: colanic acid biosynthesis glycosyl transferase WcaI [Rhodothermales bacterium]|jgi:colanic acid biosynthesis glycosyl transferase WcaI